MRSSRPSSPRGSGPRGAASRARGSSGPAQRSQGPGRSQGAARSRASAAAQPEPRRPRFTGRAAILVLVVAVLMVSYASSMRSYLEQKQHLASLRESIADSKANIDELEREKRRWKDPAYVEAQARQRFGWVMPGETGYQVIGRDGEPLSADDSLTDPDAVAKATQPEWWETAWATVEAAGDPEAGKKKPADRIRAPKKKDS